MKFSKSKWLAYTVLVGLIPILARLLIWTSTAPGATQVFSATDFVAFGMVLHISIINEIEHLPQKDKEWKTVQNGTSLLFIALYSALFSLSIIAEKSSAMVDSSALLRCSVILSIVSTILSLTVFQRLSAR